MKALHTLVIIIASIISAATITSCDIEIDSNGALDGYWHLTSVDTLKTGGTRDMTNNKIFWSVQKNLLGARDLQNGNGEIIFRFKHTGDSLLLSNPFLVDRDKGDTKITNTDNLCPLGINEISDSFLVEKLQGEKMILKSKVVRLNFLKF